MNNSDSNLANTFQLIKGQFSPMQAIDIVFLLISQKINYHKLEELHSWETDHNFDSRPLKRRIKELEDEKQRAEEFIHQAKSEGKNLSISGIIEMTKID